MPIDPNIALGVKPIQLESPVNQMAQMYQLQNVAQSNQLNKMKMDEYTRGVAEDEQVKNALTRLDKNSPTYEQDRFNAYALKGIEGVKAYAATRKEESQTETSALERTKLTGDIGDAEHKRTMQQHDETIKEIASVNTPTDIISKLDKFVSQKKLTSDEATEIKASMPSDPAQFHTWQTNLLTHITDAKTQIELTKPNWVERTDGKTKWLEDTNSRSSTFGQRQGKDVTMQPSADTLYNASKPVYNENAGGFVTPPTAASPKGGFTPLSEVQATKDVNANRKALKTAGYDPITGVDNISKLIDKSTGSWTGTLTDASLGGVLGVSTEGSKAIQQLKTFASTLTTDLLGGKLGAGISNTDRDFILEGLGNVADSTRPRGDRLAAWEGVKARMISAGMFNDKQNIIPKDEKMPPKLTPTAEDIKQFNALKAKNKVPQ